MRTKLHASLAACFLIACGDEQPEKLSVDQLMDPAECKQCHERYYDEWSGSMHAYAAEDPVFRAMNARGQEETGGKLGTFCVNCHAPLAVALELTDNGLDLDDEVPKHLQGVTCYVCHNVESIEDDHNNKMTLAMDQTMRGNFDDPAENSAHYSVYSRKVHSAAPESAALCGSCHDIRVPTELTGAAEDVHLERTYQEYQQTVYSTTAGLTTCALCHMKNPDGTDGTGVVADVEGVALQRRNINSHTMPGIDIALTEFPDRERQLREVKQFIDTSMRATLCVSSGGLGPVRVELDNFGAGHHFPSGASQDRRVWLELIAYDSEHKVLFSSGMVDATTPVVETAGTDANLVLFRDKIFDKDGNEAHMFWEAASVESNTIPGTVTNKPVNADGTENPDFFIPLFDASYPVQLPPAEVTLRIMIRPMGLEVIDELIGTGHLDGSLRDAFPTFALIPNRGLTEPGLTTDVTVRWTPEARANCVSAGEFVEGRTQIVDSSGE